MLIKRINQVSFHGWNDGMNQRYFLCYTGTLTAVYSHKCLGLKPRDLISIWRKGGVNNNNNNKKHLLLILMQ